MLQWGENRSGFTAGAGGWVQCSAHSLEGAVCRDHAQYPVFALDTSEVAVGFLVFCILFPLCPSSCIHALISISYSFFVSCCSWRLLSRYKHCSKGSQPVSLPLLKTFRPQSHHFLQSSLTNGRPHSLFLSQTNQGQILVPS